jgi:hypothetical protein
VRCDPPPPLAPGKPFMSALRSTLPLLLIVLLLTACSSASPRRDPTGELFPTVTGTSLQGHEVELPEAFRGGPTILLVGYLQETQFDLDRWLMGLLMAEAPVPFFEVPTIPGLAPTAISGWIDDGMRSGIPEEDWGAVVTCYGSDADPIAALTGTENGRNTRVLLLDGDGRVTWFHDRGFSARLALELVDEARALLGEG